ncbi:MAG: hypothetical protein ACIARR_00935, partial [Phycisphaerales bacterium JB059]
RLTEQGADRYALAAPPSVIRAADVLTRGVHLTGAPEDRGVIARLDAARIEALGEQTIADLGALSTPGEAPETPSSPPEPGESPPEGPAGDSRLPSQSP